MINNNCDKQTTKQQHKAVSDIFKWSNHIKSTHISTHNNTATIKKFTNYCHISLLQPSLSTNPSTNQQWKIKINKITIYHKLKNFICLGICSKSHIKKYDNYSCEHINWQQTGHGFYLINESGNMFSHSQKEFNNVQKGFWFTEGDVILITYDCQNSKLRFQKVNQTKQQQAKIIEMPIQSLSQKDQYYACVLMCHRDLGIYIPPVVEIF